MEPAEMFKVRGEDIDIQLGRWPGKGGPLLCLHGLTANLRCFELVAEGLAGDYQVLAMDLRGRGLSDKPASGYSLEHHCRDIAALMAELDLDKITLVGHSLGAYISLAFAADHPELVERMVLLDGGGELSPRQWQEVGAGIQAALERLGKVFPSLEEYLAPFHQLPYFTPWNRCIENYFRYETETVPGGVRSRVRPENIAEERANLARVSPSQLYSRVRCPVLILRATRGLLGEGGLVLPAQAARSMLEQLPRARMVELPGRDHYSILFQPDAQRDRAIREFLEAG